jgi:2-methylcitrate dehydratase PrpD
MGIAGANTPLPSLREWASLVDLPMFKVADAGWVSQMAISATLLARRGSTGYASILDNKVGFWRFFGSDTLDHEALLGGLGKQWRILDTTYKPWPACRWNQYPLTAFLKLKAEYAFRPEDIEKIVVRANPFALSPRFHVQQPTTPVNAQFSHAHTIAMGAFDIPVGPLWYSKDNIDGEHIRAFRSKVTVGPEPLAANLADWLKGGQFRKLPGGVDVYAGGRVSSATVEMAGGDPWSAETLFTDEWLRRKFVSMVTTGSPGRTDARAKQALRIIELVDELEHKSDVVELSEALGAFE